MQCAIDKMVREISSILSDVKPSIYLYGSSVLDDFKLGWSDIDILNDAQIVRKLNKFEKASKTLDSKLYFSLGIALIGNGKDRTLSVFSKKTEKEWKKSVISSNK